MALTLPTCPRVREFFPRLVYSGNDIEPVSGPSARESRLGSKWAFDIELDTMEYAARMKWMRLETETDTVLWPIPQPGIDTAGQGTPRVKGAGQAGNSILVDGITPGYTVQEGRWINIVTDSQRYTYNVTGDVTANGSGEALIGVLPILRWPHADNDVVELASPVLEGFVRRGSISGAIKNRYRRNAGVIDGLGFTITERT